ncbi:MAG: PIN domain-containing protein [Niveispirillum sp.]|uniref:PIN domain-containing protein n=1 Tax=Niveispirillum sp. TaxID=1917217 RepID=UPI004036648F
MKLHLLIDTSVWLDLAKDYQQLPLLDALAVMKDAGELALIVPQVVVDEFDRNKERVIADSKRSLSSHFKLVREALLKFAPEEGRKTTLEQVNDVDHRIATGGEAMNDAIDIIEKMFASSEKIEITDAVKARAADRAILKVAPFHRQRNGIDDAILIEAYIDALAERNDPEDVYAFVTHNIHDFSDRGGDTRLPHTDLAPLFDGTTSRYATNLGPLMGEFADDILEGTRFEREYHAEPRKLSELLEAEDKLTQQIWYGRKWGIIARVESGKERRVPREVWDAATPEEQRNMIVDTIWDGMLAAMKRTEETFPDELGPWTDFEWGMLSGKLSAIRWVLGDEWDMLDT